MKTIFVAGHQGMVGSALIRQLKTNRDIKILTRSRQQLDLLSQVDVFDFLQHSNIDQIYLAAAKVGGIFANNTYPAEFIYQNLSIQNNVIHGAYQAGIQKLLFLGSSCIYPRSVSQPMREEALLTAPLEPTNEPYALAKIAGIKMCESYNRQYNVDYRSVMPTNLYGSNDNFHPQNSHVIPGLIQRFHNAKLANDKEVTVWGSGTAMREFLHVDDMAAACVHVMNLDKPIYEQNTQEMCSQINVGTGNDCTIKEVAELIANVVGFNGKLIFDHSKPDGAPRKLVDVSRLHNLAWQHSIELKEGLASTYQWFLEHQDTFRA